MLGNANPSSALGVGSEVTSGPWKAAAFRLAPSNRNPVTDNMPAPDIAVLFLFMGFSLESIR
jgi:hypothetical protein